MDQSQPHHHPLHDQQQQQQHHQQPQDVLAEARKNLQALIDSGLSRDLLHQLVDDGAPLQLTVPLSSPPSLPSIVQQPTQQSPTQSHPSSSPLVPPAPQCPPPPIPSQHAPQHAQPDAQQHGLVSPVTTATPAGELKSEAPRNDELTGMS